MLIRGHLVAQGPAAPDDAVRATMLKLANSLAQGVTGARAEVAEALVAALNGGTAPRVRMLGSVGQADLSANADLVHGALGDFELASGEALVLVDNNAACADSPYGGETVSFVNIPLTNLSVSVDSQVDGGTASTIDCDDNLSDLPVATGANGDGSKNIVDLEPGTYTCTIVIDP